MIDGSGQCKAWRDKLEEERRENSKLRALLWRAVEAIESDPRGTNSGDRQFVADAIRVLGEER